MELIEQIAADMAEVKQMLTTLVNNPKTEQPAQKKVFNTNETAVYLGRKKSTVYKMSSAGILPKSKPNGKILSFSREALDNWLLSNPTKGSNELNNEAATYLITKKNAR